MSDYSDYLQIKTQLKQNELDALNYFFRESSGEKISDLVRKAVIDGIKSEQFRSMMGNSSYLDKKKEATVENSQPAPAASSEKHHPLDSV